MHCDKDGHVICKISDLGMSKPLQQDALTTTRCGYERERDEEEDYIYYYYFIIIIILLYFIYYLLYLFLFVLLLLLYIKNYSLYGS